MMFQGAVLDVAIRKFGKSADLIMLIEFEFAEFDLSFDILRPIVSLLLPFEMVTDSGVALNADDCAPDGSTVVVFAFEDRCHDSNLGLTVLGWMALPVKIILRCTAIATSSFFSSLTKLEGSCVTTPKSC